MGTGQLFKKIFDFIFNFIQTKFSERIFTMTIIKNAHILTMSDTGEIKNGYIIITNGKIDDVGEMTSIPDLSEAEVIDADGAFVTPGMVDAHSHIGMWEDGLNFEGSDGNEETDPITPHLRAIDAVNPMDKAFTEAAAAGITTVVTGPGSANPIGGQLLAMKTVGKCVDKSQTPTTRMAVAAQIREALYKASEYMDRINKAEADEDEEMPDFDMKLEALLPIMKGELPLHVHAHRADDIFTAIRIAEEFDIKLVLVHATEGHLIWGELKEKNIPVLAGPILTDRSKPELKNMSEITPAVLTAAGIKTAIITDHPETPQKHLALCAGMAVRYGMSVSDALHAITSVPAEICGIGDRVGKISAGYDADIVVWNGAPLDITSAPRLVLCDGNKVG